MQNSKRKSIYLLLTVLCVVGYIWIFINQSNTATANAEVAGVCLVKHITDYPCPACGSTRSVSALIQGKIQDAFYWNPFGIIITMILLITPLWLLYDTIRKSDTLLRSYLATESFLRKKPVAMTAITLVLLNWIWNINKGL